MKKLFIISSKSGRSYDEKFERELLKYFDKDEIKVTKKAPYALVVLQRKKRLYLRFFSFASRFSNLFFTIAIYWRCD